MARRQDIHSSDEANLPNLSVPVKKYTHWKGTLAARHPVMLSFGKEAPVADREQILMKLKTIADFLSKFGAQRGVRRPEPLSGTPSDHWSLYLETNTLVPLQDSEGRPLPVDVVAEDVLFIDSINELTSEIMDDELEAFAEQYRRLLRENMATGEDAVVRDTLNRVRLQERILDSVHLVSQKEACELLGMSKKNPAATMKRKEENRELLRFNRDGRAVYPLLQFDPDARRIYPEIKEMISMTEDWRSNYQILSWLIRPHLDFDGSPAEALKTQGDAVVAAFARETAAPSHG